MLQNRHAIIYFLAQVYTLFVAFGAAFETVSEEIKLEKEFLEETFAQLGLVSI